MKGAIFLYYQYEFPDGFIRDKYFIILNNHATDDHILACITTSQPNNRPETEGCHHKDNLYVLEANTDYFYKKTWIKFYTIIKFRQEFFLRVMQDGGIEHKAIL